MSFAHVGPLAIIGAAILWSLDGLLRRSLFSLPPTVVVFWEHLLGVLILAPVLLYAWKRFRDLTRKQWIAIIVVSLLSGAIGTIFYTAALGKIQFIPFSVVVLLQLLQPLFAIGAASILLKEQISKRFIGLAIVAFGAAYLISFPELRVNIDTGDGTTIAALLAIGAAASWGISTALSKYALSNTSVPHITGLRFGFTAVFALLFTLLLGHGAALGTVSADQWMGIVTITLITGLGALLLYYYGLKRVMASRSTIFELTWPLSAVVIGYVFLGERLSFTQWIGAVVLIAVMTFFVREQKQFIN